MRGKSNGGWRVENASTKATTASVPWQRYEPGSKIEPFVSQGTGEFVSKPDSAVTPSTAVEGDRVTLNLVNAPIAQAAKTVLGDILKVNYSLSDKLSGNITVQTTSSVPREALIDLFETALKANGATIMQTNGFYRIVPATNAGQSGLQMGSDGQRSPLGVQLRIIPLRHISASEARRVLEPVLPQGAIVRVDDDRNIIVVAGTTRELGDMASFVSVFDVDWLKGMSFAMFPLKASDPEALAKELDAIFGLDKDGALRGVVRFLPNKRLGAILAISSKPAHIDTVRTWITKLDRLAENAEEQLFVYKVRNRSATELASLLSRVLSPTDAGQTAASTVVAPGYEPQVTTVAATAGSPFGPRSPRSGFAGSDSETPARPSAANGQSGGASSNKRVVADESNSSLLIFASSREYERITRILERLDVLPVQVMLEAMIAEVTLNDELKFGVKWFFEHGNKGSFTLTDAVSGAVASHFPGFSYFFSSGNVKTVLDAMSGITTVNVVSAPSLMVLDNRRAVLQVGDQVPIITQTAQAVTVPGSPIVNSVTFRDTGVILAVTPRVNDSGRVVLEIEQEVSNVARTTSSGIDSPTIQQRRIKTTVSVADGEMLALGGLIQERDNTDRTQVPILGNFPVLGAAFRNKTDSINRTELLIIIRPLVVRDASEGRAVTEEFRRRLNLQAPASKVGRDSYDRDARRILH
jgi:general secretion pathway protein D